MGPDRVSAGSQQDVRRARTIEAAYFEALRGFGDSEALRLESLKASLVAKIAENRKTSRFAELLLVPGEPPRLWIDLVTSVVMEPDSRTYRVIQETGSEAGSAVLQTRKRDEALGFLMAYLAERSDLNDLSTPWREESVSESGNGRWSTGFVLYAWLTGFVFGLLIILVAYNALK